MLPPPSPCQSPVHFLSLGVYLRWTSPYASYNVWLSASGIFHSVRGIFMCSMYLNSTPCG